MLGPYRSHGSHSSCDPHPQLRPSLLLAPSAQGPQDPSYVYGFLLRHTPQVPGPPSPWVQWPTSLPLEHQILILRSPRPPTDMRCPNLWPTPKAPGHCQLQSRTLTPPVDPHGPQCTPHTWGPLCLLQLLSLSCHCPAQPCNPKAGSEDLRPLHSPLLPLARPLPRDLPHFQGPHFLHLWPHPQDPGNHIPLDTVSWSLRLPAASQPPGPTLSP